MHQRSEWKNKILLVIPQICEVWGPPRGLGQVMGMEQLWQLEQIVSMLISDHSCSHISKCLHWTMAWECCPEVLHLAQPLKNPFVYIFSLPWCSHLYKRDTVVYWGQFNRMKHSVGTRDTVGKLETFIPLVQSQVRFSFQQTKKEASRACNTVGPVYSGLLMLHQIVLNERI